MPKPRPHVARMPRPLPLLRERIRAKLLQALWFVLGRGDRYEANKQEQDRIRLGVALGLEIWAKGILHTAVCSQCGLEYPPGAQYCPTEGNHVEEADLMARPDGSGVEYEVTSWRKGKQVGAWKKVTR